MSKIFNIKVQARASEFKKKKKSVFQHYSQQNLLSHFLPQNLCFQYHHLVQIRCPLFTCWLITAQALVLLGTVFFVGWTGYLHLHHSPFLLQSHVCSFFSQRPDSIIAVLPNGMLRSHGHFLFSS